MKWTGVDTYQRRRFQRETVDQAEDQRRENCPREPKDNIQPLSSGRIGEKNGIKEQIDGPRIGVFSIDQCVMM